MSDDTSNLIVRITVAYTYGIRLKSIFGGTNIDGESQVLRLLDTGIATVPHYVGGSTMEAGEILVSIVPVRYLPVVTVVDIDPVQPGVKDLCVWANLTASRDANNWFDEISVKSFAAVDRLVRWRIWGYI